MNKGESSFIDLEPETGGTLPLRIVSRPFILIGRNGEECDIVTRVLPRNEENDRETLRLSQIHTIVEVEEDTFRIRDGGSSAGTFWNDTPVEEGGGILIPKNSKGIIRNGTRWEIEFRAGIDHGAFIPTDRQWGVRSCIWLYGNEASCDIGVFSGVETEHSLIPSVFGVEKEGTIIRSNGGLSWRDQPQDLLGLSDGVKLKIGDLRFEVNSGLGHEHSLTQSQ